MFAFRFFRFYERQLFRLVFLQAEKKKFVDD